MAVDMFLKIAGIDGDSRDAKHKGEIEIMSYSWGISQTGATNPGGGGGAGKVQVQDFSIVKQLDKTSPVLMEKCCTGEHIDQILIGLSRKAGGSQEDFYKIKLTDCLISSYQTGGANTGGAFPVDQVSFSFGDVTIMAADRFGKFTEVSCNFIKNQNGLIQNHDHEK
jgi:type VI secretion system secreted protein Hcp